MTEITLYLHIPFCRARCDYCDFFTRTHVHPERQQQIIDRTIAHAMDSLRRWYHPRAPISSIYVGGGTPSSLHSQARRRLLSGIRACIDYGTVVPNSEITVEVNPEDVDRSLLNDLHESGVNRLSLGIQSLTPSVLTRIGRHTSLSATRRGLEEVATHWGTRSGMRWSADIITAVPDQSISDAAHDIRNVLEYCPRHVSLYELGIEPGTRLAQTYRRRTYARETDELRYAQHRAAADALTDAGLEQYEISSFAVPGDESRHNISYWQLHPWAAAGPGAVALLPGRGGATHFTVGRSFQQYLDRDDFSVTAESLTPQELCEEYFMGGFRMTRGVSNATLRAVFGCTLPELIPATLEAWAHHVRATATDYVSLTPAGQLLLNRFLVDAFGEIERSVNLPSAPAWPEPRRNAASIDTSAT
ncbi:MAG: radical SAM family heme chaperone HemW [Alkalispirochaeta sp.]